MNEFIFIAAWIFKVNSVIAGADGKLPGTIVDRPAGLPHYLCNSINLGAVGCPKADQVCVGNMEGPFINFIVYEPKGLCLYLTEFFIRALRKHQLLSNNGSLFLGVIVKPDHGLTIFCIFFL